MKPDLVTLEKMLLRWGKTAFSTASWPTGQPRSSTTNTTTTEKEQPNIQSIRKKMRQKKSVIYIEAS